METLRKDCHHLLRLVSLDHRPNQGSQVVQSQRIRKASRQTASRSTIRATTSSAITHVDEQPLLVGRYCSSTAFPSRRSYQTIGLITHRPAHKTRPSGTCKQLELSTPLRSSLSENGHCTSLLASKTRQPTRAEAFWCTSSDCASTFTAIIARRGGLLVKQRTQHELQAPPRSNRFKDHPQSFLHSFAISCSLPILRKKRLAKPPSSSASWSTPTMQRHVHAAESHTIVSHKSR